MEEACSHDEEPEERQLKEETNDDDLLAGMEEFQGPCCLDATTSCLDKETDHVACHENLREPLLPDEGVLFTIDEKNDAAENDVNGCSEKRRGD